MASPFIFYYFIQVKIGSSFCNVFMIYHMLDAVAHFLFGVASKEK